ncbi:MAG TPA: hypothetical protein VGJ51_14200 [Candidatus Angelobacter sp.]|jgi:hypothetical protein
MDCEPDCFATGATVPASGIYVVAHAPHRLTAEVALFKGEIFPKCGRCSGIVRFRMMRVFHGLDAIEKLTYRVPLYELEANDAEAEPTTATSGQPAGKT